MLINHNEKIFIAGSSGMVGSGIVRALIKNGYNNLITPNRDELDLFDRSRVKEWFHINNPSIVIIAAAKVGGIYANDVYPADFILENLKIQTNLIEIAYESKVKRLLFLGSSCIYPKFASQPIKEEELLSGPLEETNQWYAIAKIAGIKLCQALRKQHDFDAFSLMPTNLYGPGDNYHLKNSHVIPGLIRKFHDACILDSKEVVCWGTGESLREFLHVDDLSEACVFLLEHWDPERSNIHKSGQDKMLSFLNVGTGVDIKIKDLATLISNIMGFKGKIIWDTSKPDGTPRKLLDVSRINKLGWKSKIKINEGLIDTIKSFKKELNSGKLRK